MSEISSINENDTNLDILCDDAMDNMENVAVIKSSGKLKRLYCGLNRILKLIIMFCIFDRNDSVTNRE